jgi:hypothetical protein
MSIKRESLPVTMQGEFGLAAFPGRVFVVNEQASWDDQIVVDVVKDGKRMNFGRESLSALVHLIRPIVAK